MEDVTFRRVAVQNTHGGVLLFSKSNIAPWVFFKLYKWYQIVQSLTYLNPFYANVPFLYPLKKPENL